MDFFQGFQEQPPRFLFAILGVANAFPAERAVFLRETQDSWDPTSGGCEERLRPIKKY